MQYMLLLAVNGLWLIYCEKYFDWFWFPNHLCIFICTNELEQATNLHKAIPPEKVKNNAVLESKTEHR